MENTKITPIKLLLRAVSGFVGGLFGTLMLLIVFVLGSSVMDNVFKAEELSTEVINPVFLAVFLIMIFMGLIIANLFSTMLVSFCDKDKYFKRASIMHQIFIFNIVLFFVVLPFYVFSLVLDFGTLSIIALLHSFLSLAGSHLILESIANPRYNLLAIYGTSFGIILGVAVNLIIFKITGTVNILLFAFLPVTWFFMTLAQSLAEALYTSFYKLYGIDFLGVDTSFGMDYISRPKTETEEIEDEVDIEMKKKKDPKDKTGAEFLNES